MSGINGGVITFEPFNQLTYEYRVTALGVIMLVFAAFALLLLGLDASTPDIIPFFFIGVLVLATTINWTVMRHRQKKFMQQFESEYRRMKQVFAQPR